MSQKSSPLLKPPKPPKQQKPPEPSKPSKPSKPPKVESTPSKPPRTRKGGWVDPSKLTRNDDGRPQCRWCTGSVQAPRRTFCCDECVHQHRIRTNTKYMRLCVYKRDAAICAECQQDTKKIAREAKQYRNQAQWKQYYELLEQYSIPTKRKVWTRGFGGGLWDADHIVAVKDGGGDCGLENIRTLCIKCHKANTALQRKTWAKKCVGDGGD